MVRRFLWLLVALGFVAALVCASARWRVEARNRRVEITLDYLELRSLAAAEGEPLAEVLKRFRAAGATSVAVPEDTLGGLEEARRLQVTARGRNGASLRAAPEEGKAPPLGPRIFEAIRHKTRVKVTSSDEGRSGMLLVRQPVGVIRALGIGLDPEAVAEVRAAKLGIVARLGNWQGVTPEGVRWTLRRVTDDRASTVIFSGDEVLGYKGFVAADPALPGQSSTETLLRELGLYFGAVEFVKQKGDDLLAKAAQDRTVRVHTVPGAEMQTADIPSNVQRFLLAARERNIRLLFVRLFPAEPSALAANTGYVGRIADGLARGGLSAGLAHGYGTLRASPAWRFFMGLGLAAAWCLLLDALTGLSAAGGAAPGRGAAGIGSFLLVAAAALPGAVGPKLAALAAACLYPTLALVHTDLLRPVSRLSCGEGRLLPPRLALEYAFRRLLAVTGITVLGITTVVGLLADRVFLIKADAFMGIKAAQLIPVAVAAAVYWLGLRATPDRLWPRVLSDARRRVAALSREPILLCQVGSASLALVVFLLLVLRSGNDPGVGVSPLELHVRGVLDRLLYARPRFKEFLIGHPAMIVALGLASTGRRKWVLPLFILGAIGQVSLLNTFCHLHTPLLVSLLRALLAFAIGVIIGVAAYLWADRVSRSPRAARVR